MEKTLKTSSNSIRELLSICLISLLPICFFFTFISVVLKFPIQVVLSAFIKSFGFGQFPQIPNQFLEKNLFSTLYVLFFIHICFLFIFSLVQRLFKLKLFLPSLPKAISISALILFLVIIPIRQLKLNQLFSNTITQYSELTADEYYSKFHDASYPFVKFCKSKITGRHRGMYVTDLDLTSYEMIVHRRMGYHLYPTVDIRINTDNPDVLIVHWKKNPEAAVPKDFKIIGKFNAVSLIAIKDDSLH